MRHLPGHTADDQHDDDEQHDARYHGIPGRCEDGTHVDFPYYLVEGIGESGAAHCKLADARIQRRRQPLIIPMASSYRASAASHRYVLDEVRAADRDRFLAALFAPEPQRSDLLALLAFDHELARTRRVTREPLLARIRLEWWREAVVEAVGQGQPRAQPIVESLSETVRRHGLAPEQLVALIEARAEEIDGPLDVVRAGHALADLELAVLGLDHAPPRR